MKLIRIIIFFLFLTGNMTLGRTEYNSYKLEFMDRVSLITVNSKRFYIDFCPLVLDSISNSLEYEKPNTVHQHASIKLYHNYIKDTVQFDIINFEFLLIIGKYYKIDSNYIFHFENVLPNYYYESIKNTN